MFMYSNVPVSSGIILTAQRLGNKCEVRSGRMIQIRICLTERVLWVHVARWGALHLCTHSRVPIALTSKS